MLEGADLAASSTYFRSAAFPFPSPNVLVGVLTDIKMSWKEEGGISKEIGGRWKEVE